MYNEFLESLEVNPVIAAVRNLEMLDEALKSPCEIIFLLTGNIFNLKDIVKKCKENKKQVYIHLDLLDGFSRDIIAMKYISDNIKPSGIITTKSKLVGPAKKQGLFVIQRLFILDSLSLDTGIKLVEAIRPDAIEIMPGIMTKITDRFLKRVRLPIIAGGLIQEKEDVIDNLRVGAVGVSTSKSELWYV